MLSIADYVLFIGQCAMIGAGGFLFLAFVGFLGRGVAWLYEATWGHP